MKKLLFIVVTLVTVFSFSSCSVFVTQTRIREYDSKQHNTQAYSDDMKVRVDYDNIIKYESSELKLKQVGGISGAIQVTKFDCIYDNNFDVLVDPIFKVIKTSRKKVIVTLQCHPGYYEKYVGDTASNEKSGQKCAQEESSKKVACFPIHKKKCENENTDPQVEVNRNKVIMKSVTINCETPIFPNPKDVRHKGGCDKEQGCREYHSKCDGPGDCHQSEGDSKANNDGKSGKKGGK